MKVLHGALSCSLKQITKSTIKIFVTTCIRVMQIDIDFKHDVLVCFEGIAQTFENPKYVKPPPHESIASCALRVFFTIGLLQTQCICLGKMEF
jgi:hypothetical protein